MGFYCWCEMSGRKSATCSWKNCSIGDVPKFIEPETEVMKNVYVGKDKKRWTHTYHLECFVEYARDYARRQPKRVYKEFENKGGAKVRFTPEQKEIRRGLAVKKSLLSRQWRHLYSYLKLNNGALDTSSKEYISGQWLAEEFDPRIKQTLIERWDSLKEEYKLNGGLPKGFDDALLINNKPIHNNLLLTDNDKIIKAKPKSG